MSGRFFIVAFALSEPGTMGGNSKIALELARHLSAHIPVHFIVPKRKVRTIQEAIGAPSGLTVHTVDDFAGSDLRHPLESVRHYRQQLASVFRECQTGPGDTVYSATDFHIDTWPCRQLKRTFGYRWIAVQFLFVPFVVENLLSGYRFPAFKYALVWAYSTVLFHLARRKADAFVITNDSDRCHFPKGFQKRVFAFYGGVNVDQIPEGPVEKTRDVVFCSRLHPQKGIEGFLEIWRLVRERRRDVRLTVIGNGEAAYERALHEKAERLGVADSVDWLGYVNHEAKYAIYRSARVLVHPTVFDNNGMVAAEALCSGLPVVMFDLPALRDLYVDGCLKVPYADKKRFAEKVLEVLADPEAFAPRPRQLADLRARWDWSSRVDEFRRWLVRAGMPCESSSARAENMV